MSPVQKSQARPGSRKRSELRLALAAAILLLACGALWLYSSSHARERRDATLATVPDFPARDQPAQHPRRAPQEVPRHAQVVKKLPAAPMAERKRVDGLTSFVLHPAHNVGVVNVNALLNTPLFAHLKECMPAGFANLNEAAASLGLDFERDVDRVAFYEGGAAVSGFFEGKPVAQALAGRFGQPAATQTYRDTTIYSLRNFAVAQLGNVVVQGSSDSIQGLIDRVLDPPPDSADPQDVYGDVFLRSDLDALRGGNTSGSAPDAVTALLGSLSGMTVRANVWDSVALSVEGKPNANASVADLSRMARGALQLARDQIDQEDVELGTLADLARVSGADDGLHVDLALPAKDLLEKLHFPCPGKQEPPPAPPTALAR